MKVINGRRGALKKFALTAATSAIGPASAATRLPRRLPSPR